MFILWTLDFFDFIAKWDIYYIIYENEYVICTVNRVPDSFWTLSKRYDNVHIVSQKMLFATYKKEYNKIAHPRFVPSFVK